MKLRIRGNSLRLRLQQQEVQLLEQEGIVVEETCFGEQSFSYSLVSDKIGTAIRAELESQSIRIFVPTEKIKEWANSDDISILGDQQTPRTTLKILIEKDFACIKPRTSAQWEDDSDAFPNPNPSCGG
ncbi:MAG: hypothetical protein EXR74_02585 [Bdellovibrionales bacterium]|nr:hypothetical protein [Bdellovibrionales bacterium]